MDRLTDGQTRRQTDRCDLTNVIVAFRNYANAPVKLWDLVYFNGLGIPSI